MKDEHAVILGLAAGFAGPVAVDRIGWGPILAVPGAIVAGWLTVAATVFLVRRHRVRRRQREQARAVADYRRQLEKATDLAITAAVHAQLAEPVTDLAITIPLRVTTGDVIARAQADFALRVPQADAAAMLRSRLKFKGHAGWSHLITDAFDDEETRP
ncbi:hypothetical protein [Streptomyces sp. NBC_01304]|uniref:hypothetical protein n=1 Tax=Streptomyces sp. NBC_01304 TaxID=2903818 RepID=UPI002E132A02|nr:hypothetical protein OG430_49105 [Streptomyces sp. NBC_01304]